MIGNYYSFRSEASIHFREGNMQSISTQGNKFITRNNMHSTRKEINT